MLLLNGRNLTRPRTIKCTMYIYMFIDEIINIIMIVVLIYAHVCTESFYVELHTVSVNSH